MRTLLHPAFIALAAAAVLAATASREPLMPRLVRLEAAAALPEMAPRLADEPLGVNAVLLEYADDPALRLNAHLALLRHPELARLVLPLYGGEPEFRDVLREHGPAVMPPIAYFMNHEVRSLEVMRAAGEALSGAKAVALRLLGVGADRRDDPARSDGETRDSARDIGPVERGWYAIGFIRDEGHDFLGQFTVDARGEVAWVQTERLTEAASAFFTGGIRTLETRFRMGEDPDLTDYLWAGVDVALAAGAVKALRLGRAAGSGTRATGAARGGLAARNVVRAGRGALRVGKYVAPVAVGYAVVRHPSLVSALGAQVASIVGWPVPVVQALVWFLVLLPLLLVARLALGWLLGPAALALRAASRGVITLERRLRPRRRVHPEPAPESTNTPRLDDGSRTE